MFVIIALMLTWQASAKDLSIMFASRWDDDAVALMLRSVDEGDYLSRNIPGTGRLPVPVTLFSLPPSVDKVIAGGARPCPTGGARELIVYDPEHWEHTPAEERENLKESINKAQSIVHDTECHQFGLAPGGRVLGVATESCSGDASEFIDIVDWKKVDLFVVQAQGLLSRRCTKTGNVDPYAEFVRGVVEAVKARNDKIKVLVSMSFRYTRPEVMVSAIGRTRGFVDGYYVAYPINKSGDRCRYCTKENLSVVVDAIKFQ